MSQLAVRLSCALCAEVAYFAMMTADNACKQIGNEGRT